MHHCVCVGGELSPVSSDGGHRLWMARRTTLAQAPRGGGGGCWAGRLQEEPPCPQAGATHYHGAVSVVPPTAPRTPPIWASAWPYAEQGAGLGAPPQQGSAQVLARRQVLALLLHFAQNQGDQINYSDIRWILPKKRDFLN